MVFSLKVPPSGTGRAWRAGHLWPPLGWQALLCNVRGPQPARGAPPRHPLLRCPAAPRTQPLQVMTAVVAACRRAVLEAEARLVEALYLCQVPGRRAHAPCGS